MPNRLSKILSRSSNKEKEALAEAEAGRGRSNGDSDSPPPPQYSAEDQNIDRDNVLDPPDITAGFKNLKLDRLDQELPQVDQCIAHLKVLECFYRLRQKIGSTDGLYGIENSVVTDVTTDGKESSEALAKLAEKRWAIYVSNAVQRYDVWFASLFPRVEMARYSDLHDQGKAGTLCKPCADNYPLQFDVNNMPPADVLMVWHAYMLNPRAFLEDCLRLGRMKMWHAGFPWKAAVDCIDAETFAYTPGEETMSAFTALTGLSWDNLDGPNKRSVVCPGCETLNEVPFSTSFSYAPDVKKSSSKDLNTDVDDMLSLGNGYCDREFSALCRNCDSEITHERLKARKFCKDVETLLMQDVPMGGTLLGLQGIPWKFRDVTEPQCAEICLIPNALLRHGLGSNILTNKKSWRSLEGNQSMQGIRDMLEDSLQDKTYVRSVRGRFGRMTPAERISIRKMMSRYWENSSTFALDLVGAVIRQGSFIEKMHNIDWLHSPALPSTMKRLLVKYTRFVSIMKDKHHMAVPTLDVDLAWHTHQLSPYWYMDYTVKTTGQFIDHDDKVAETKLNDAFAWTSKTYQNAYGEPYSECTCWYCEATRESHTNVASRLFKTSNSQANDQLPDGPHDPRSFVHISAHNAVRPSDGNYNANAKLKADQLEKHYQKACDRARKKGRQAPSRNDYYYSDAYGYPVYIPAYSPYIMWYGYSPMYYPSNPGCMALTAGAAGACCQGTCGGGVAGGSCAGGAGGACSAGAGGCAGGAAGGCGSGAGGGCGGGGGGGGCGGGGGGGGCGGGGGG